MKLKKIQKDMSAFKIKAKQDQERAARMVCYLKSIKNTLKYM